VILRDELLLHGFLLNSVVSLERRASPPAAALLTGEDARHPLMLLFRLRRFVGRFCGLCQQFSQRHAAERLKRRALRRHFRDVAGDLFIPAASPLRWRRS